MMRKSDRFVSGVLLLAVGCLAAGSAKAGDPVAPQAGTATLVATASSGISSFGKSSKKETNLSWNTDTLRLRQNQGWWGFENYTILLNFDTQPVKGWTVKEAWLHLALAKGEVYGLGACTVLNDWKEVAANGEEVAGAPSWDYRATPAPRKEPTAENMWSWPVSGLFSVTWSHPSLRYSHAGPGQITRYTDATGQRWVKLPLDPALVHAMAAGVSYGIVLTEDKGQVAEAAMLDIDPKPYTYHPGFETEVYSAHAGKGALAPKIEVAGGVEDHMAPAAPQPIPQAPPEVEPSTGAAWLSFVAPGDDGMKGRALAYEVRYSEAPITVENWSNAAAIPRYDIPLPVPGGEKQRLRIADVKPGHYHVGIRALDKAGNLGGLYAQELVLPVPVVAQLRQSKDPAPSFENRMVVWAVSELAKVSPVSGECVSVPGKDYQGVNPVWNAAEKTVRVRAARNEVAGFQVVLQRLGEPLNDVSVTMSDLKSSDNHIFPAAKNVEFFREWYLNTQKDGAAWFPDACLPLVAPFETTFNIPAKDNVGDAQQNQAVFVDVYVPKETVPGRYTGTLTVHSPSLKNEVSLAVELTVRPFALPDEITFPMELGTYSGISDFAGVDFDKDPERAIKVERSYYQMAHKHRCTLDILHYRHSGRITEKSAPALDGEGAGRHISDWTSFDLRFGPLLDGSAFTEAQGYHGPGMNTPLSQFYLPYHENWPMNLDSNYNDKADFPTRASFGEWAKTSRRLEETISPAYIAGCKRVIVQMMQHFAEKKWTQTHFEFFLNNKYYTKVPMFSTKAGSGHCYWLMDEPIDFDDFDANRFFHTLAKQAVAESGVTSVKTYQRSDIDYPEMARGLVDGVVDLWCASNAGDTFRLRQRWMPGEKWMHYSSQIDVSASGQEQVQPFLHLYAWGMSVLAPYWNCFGEGWTKPDTLSIYYTGVNYAGTKKVYDGAIASMRMKFVRRGEQDIEYANLLARCPGWDQDRVIQALRAWSDDPKAADPYNFKHLTLDDSYRLREALAATIQAP